ncbi:MAG: hypothetical protein C5B43_01905 [Verrucomicrobia bacterium]|nr:MAG: hypothetical protein C5B43_01905 [Verrucomicrobiota bacterium]
MQKNKISNWSKAIIIAWIVITGLVISWLVPLTRLIWDYLDAITYLSLHSSFLQTEFSQKFWAVMNSRIADNASHSIFILIFLYSIFKNNGELVKKKTCKVLFILLTTVLSVLASKGIQSELSKHFTIKRESPSLVLGRDVALSQVLPNLKNVKDASQRSFPGDHAMTLFLLYGFIFWSIKSIPLRLIGILAMLFFILPRLISGGHWLTDLIMGSLPIAVLAFTVWTILYKALEKFFTRKKSLDILKEHSC